MPKQKVRIYTIHSQRGGVGKTSLAVAIAGWSSSKHKLKTLIIDCDLTGTSLIDLFWKCDTKQQNHKEIHYLNRLLLASPIAFSGYEKGDMESTFYLTVPNCKNLYYIPSSPVLKDIRSIVALISQENMLHFFQSRMTDILSLVVKNEVKTIIIDNPPGLFGLSRAMINLEISSEDNWEKKALFITTSDRIDYRAMLASFSEYWEEKKQPNKPKTGVGDFDFLLNKFSGKKFREPVFAWQAILDDLKGPNPFPDERSVNEKTVGEIESRLKKIGAGACPFVDGFDMGYIIMTIERLVNNKSRPGEMGKWCEIVKEMAGL